MSIVSSSNRSALQFKLVRLLMRRTSELQKELVRGDGVLNLHRESKYFTTAVLPLNSSNINDSKEIFQILKTNLRNSPLDLSAGFATLRTLNVRLANLRNLVYNQSAHVDLSGAIRLSVQSKLDRRATRAARRRGDRFADVQRRFAFHVNVDFADNVDISPELRAQKFRSARIYGLVRDTESRFGGGLVVVSDQDREQPIDFFTKLDEVLSVPMVTRYGRLDCTIVLRKNEHFVNGLVPRSVLTDATLATLNALSGDTNAVRVTGTAPFYTRAQNDNWIVNDSTAVERAVDTPTAIDTALRLCGVTLEPGDMAATVSVALCNERHTAQRQWSDQSNATPVRRKWPRVVPIATEPPRLQEHWRRNAK